MTKERIKILGTYLREWSSPICIVDIYADGKPDLVFYSRGFENAIDKILNGADKDNQMLQFAAWTATWSQHFVNAVSQKKSVNFIYNTSDKTLNINIQSLGDTEEGQSRFIVSFQSFFEANDELQYEKSSSHLTSIALRNSDISIWYWRLEDDQLHLDKDWVKSLGLDIDLKKPITFADLAGFAHAEDSIAVQDTINQLFFESLNEINLELRIKAHGGQNRWIQIRGCVTERGSDTKPLVMVGTLIDIEKQKEQELILREQEAKLKSIMAVAPIGINITDENGYFTYVNDAWRKMTGLTMRQAIGSGWFSAIHPDDRDDVVAKWQKSVESGEEFKATFRFQGEWGNAVWVNGRAAPFYDASGQRTGLIGICQDITSERASAEFAEMQRVNLAAASRMVALGEMAGGIAHEINTPLAVIKLSSDQLAKLNERDALTKEVAKKQTDRISKTVNQISTIIRGLKSFARDGSQDPFVSSSLSDIVTETLAFCSERIKVHGVELRIVGMEQKIELECAPGQIGQVILNLINNAHDAIEHLDEKWIQVEIVDRGDEVAIYVIDSGKGISKEIGDKIMQPFFTTKAVGKGTGLGLSISKGIVENHGGSLSILVAAPQTTFEIVLPKRHKAKAAA